MAMLKKHVALEIVRGVKAFLSFETGVTRGEVPDLNNQSQKLKQAQNQVAKQREQIAARDRRIVQLQGEFAKLEKESSSQLEASPAANTENTEKQGYGIGIKPGGDHYRAWVGPARRYDLAAAIQVTLLLGAGLRETHRLVDVGCGSLRAGRLLIPYLRPGNYFGVEPNQWAVEEGIKNELGGDLIRIKKPNFRFVDDFSVSSFGAEFDFGLAQSVFSHTYPDMTLAGLKGIAEALAPNGKLFANFLEGRSNNEGSGWLYPGCTSYTWEEMQQLIEESGLVARRLNWVQRFTWFVAAHPSAEQDIDELSKNLRHPLHSSHTTMRDLDNMSE